MALPAYATTGQRIGYYSFMTYCGLVFFLFNCTNICNSYLYHLVHLLFLNLQKSL